MEFVSDLFRYIKSRRRAKKERSSSSVSNPTTTQTSTNNNSPQFITNVYHCPSTGVTTPLAPMAESLLPSISGIATNVTTTVNETLDPSDPTRLGETIQSVCVAQPGTSASAPLPHAKPMVEWVVSNAEEFDSLTDKAVVGGYESNGFLLWVVRTRYGGQVLPAKLNIKTKTAYVPWYKKEQIVEVFEVCCIENGTVEWIEASNGKVPTNAVEGGKMMDGEKLYIGRATHGASLIPGKIQPSHKCCYVGYAGRTHIYKTYEVLCVL